MSSVRRWYILLVATISLQVLAWALIGLLRNLLGVWGSLETSAVAFQIAVVLIGLPVFLIHWFWAQRLAAGDRDERGAVLRRLFLYGNLAGLLGPWSRSAYNLVRGLLGLLLDPGGRWHGSPAYISDRTLSQGLLNDLTPLLVLGLFWLYYRQVASADRAAIPLAGNAALVRRFYLLGFSTAGLIVTARGGGLLLRWLLYQLGDMGAQGGQLALINPLAALLVGLPLWILPWRLAQHLFHGPDLGERESALRKFYLHAAVFFSTLAAVSGATVILAGLLRQLLGLSPQGDMRDVLPTLLVAGLVWLYHGLTLRGDLALIPEVPRQAGVRRLSWYLVASIGLGAALIGLGGILSAIIRLISTPTIGNSLRELLAWSIAALVAGLPVWGLIWRRAQAMAEVDGPGGDDERGSLVRRIYLYGFLFVATLTILGSLIYIVYQLLRVILGDPAPSNLITNLAQAIAFSCIAAGVLVYHGLILRGEGRRHQLGETTRAAELRVAVLGLGDGVLGRALIERLRHELPGLSLSPIGLTPEAAAAMGAAADPRGLATQLAEANLIITPWQAVLPQIIGSEVAQAIGASPARKLLLPTPAEGWEWAGVEIWNNDAAISQVVYALRQVLSGEPIRPLRTASPLAVIGIVVGITIMLLLIFITTIALLNMG